MRNTNSKAPHLLTGEHGEEIAADFVRKKGMKVLERNWRPAASMTRGGASLELDIVALDVDCIVFIEVKTRHVAPGAQFNPLEVFGLAKQKSLLRAATLYLETRQAWSSPCRFDLICIIISPGNSTGMEHYENVLSFEHAGRGVVGGGNAPWQPW